MKNHTVTKPESKQTYRIPNPDILRAGRFGAAHGGAARAGGAGQHGTPSGRSGQGTTLSVALQRVKRTFLDVSSEARTNEILFKPTEERNQRLIRRLPPGREALFVPGCLPVYRILFVSVNPVHARHVRETGSQSNLSNPKPGHTTGGSGRGARRSGQAGSGKIGCQRNYSPRKQKSTVLSQKTKKCRFNVSPEARTSEILCKPTGEQNHRLTRGL